jgi:maltose alpha-D-glucosyltransferase/alpha-amylase
MTSPPILPWDLGELAAFFGSRRWFRGEASSIRGLTVADLVPIKWKGSERQYGVARVRVARGESEDTYQLFFDRDAEAPRDALEDEEFRRGLIDAFHTGASFASSDGRTRWIVESEAAQPIVLPPNAPITLGSGEQSNSSIVAGQEAVLKLYRRVEPGINPDVEATRHLTRDRKFPNVPALLGTIRFEDASGVATTAGMLQEFVPGATDTWDYALKTSRPFLRGARRSNPRIPFAEDAFRLGELTRTMHEELASGAEHTPFHGPTATFEDVIAWSNNAHTAIDRASRSLEQALKNGTLAKDHVPAAQSVLKRCQEFHHDVLALSSAIGGDAGVKSRTHGDYHLGQVLRSSTGSFLIIDFEGEPLRPLNERRTCISPIRDVAGMVRSFAYASAYGASDDHETALTGVPDAQAVRWFRAVRDSVLRGYFARTDTQHPMLPKSRNNANRLYMLFKTEKVFYELQYELDHRPHWAWIPIRGIEHLYA